MKEGLGKLQLTGCKHILVVLKLVSFPTIIKAFLLHYASILYFSMA